MTLYCDLHCDALTAAGELQVTKENLHKGGCLLQCFAAFVSGKEGRFSAFLRLADKFDEMCRREGFHPVRRARDVDTGKINALLTVENGAAIEGDLRKLDDLYERGVRMLGLTWNYPNEIGAPVFSDYDGVRRGEIAVAGRERTRGLTPFGRSVLERMGELGMIVDLAHGSDPLFFETAAFRRPFVVSHAGAQAVRDCARNLTDEQIRALADCGGVIGLCFCAEFLSPDRSAEGQRQAIFAHAEHILRVGGEESLAIGSDFDGTAPDPACRTPAELPALFEEAERRFGPGVTEKIARKNFLRLFREVCG